MKRLGYTPFAILDGKLEKVDDPRKYKDVGFLFLKKEQLAESFR